MSNIAIKRGSGNFISANNSRAKATLASAATFQGTSDRATSHGRIGVSITSDNATDGILTMEVSHNGTDWGGPSRSWADTRFSQPHMWEIVEPYFRIKYVNGSTEAQNLSIITQFSNNGAILLGHQLDETLLNETEAIISRSVAVGQDVQGVYRNIGVVNKGGKTSLFNVQGFSDTHSMHLDVGTSSTLIAYTLIDLSNTTQWKHSDTGEIVIEYIIIEVDPDPNWIGEVKIGYLADVDASNGDFHQLLDIDMARKADIFSEVIDFGSHGLHCSNDDHFGPIIADSTLFQTDVNLGGPDDPSTLTYPAGSGDLVMIIDGDGTNTVDVSITIGYETVT